MGAAAKLDDEAWSTGEAEPEFTGNVPTPGTPIPEKTIHVSRRYGDSLSFARVTSIRPIGHRLVVTDRFMDPHLSLIDRETGDIALRFGRHGSGPGEFQDPTWSFVASVRPPRLWVYDFQNRRLSLIATDVGREEVVLEEVRLDVGMSLMRPVWIGGRIIANGLFPDFTLLMLDRTGKAVGRVSGAPPFTEREVPHVTGMRLTNVNYLAVDPSRRRLVLAYQFKSRLDFFAVGGAQYGTVLGPREATAKFHIERDRFFWDEGTEMAYISIDATERYVYALFCGRCTTVEPKEARVHVFTWDGDFVTELVLVPPVKVIGVTPNDSVLFGALENPFPMVGEWVLPPRLEGPT